MDVHYFSKALCIDLILTSACIYTSATLQNTRNLPSAPSNLGGTRLSSMLVPLSAVLWTQVPAVPPPPPSLHQPPPPPLHRLICFVLARLRREAEGVGGRPEIRHKSSRGFLHVRAVRWSFRLCEAQQAEQIEFGFTTQSGRRLLLAFFVVVLL